MVGFHVADSSSNFSLALSLADCLEMHPELFRDDVKIASFFGNFPVIWNGGRMVLGKFDRRRARMIIDSYNQRGIPFRFTFTNPHITKEHLGNIDCNNLLDIADNGMNEVIVYSEELEEYIRRTHPNMKITSSTCKCIRDIDDVKKELAKDYSLVVLDYNFNDDFEALEKLTPEERKRCEILTNPVCVPNCPRRAAHYDYIGKAQLDFTGICRQYNVITREMADRMGIKEWDCEHRNRGLYVKEQSRLIIRPDEIYEKYVPMGFENFKLEGRGSSMAEMCEQMVMYMAKPEHMAHARFNILGAALAHDNINN